MALSTWVLLLLTVIWKLQETKAKITTVGIPLTALEHDSLCKFAPITGGYNICQKVLNADGTQDELITTTLDILCDAVKEGLNKNCSRCLKLESPQGSNNMIPTCAVTADCSNDIEDEAGWIYLTTHQLAVEVPADQRCDGNGFKTVHEECEDV